MGIFGHRHPSYMTKIAFSMGQAWYWRPVVHHVFEIFHSIPVYIPPLSLCTAPSEGDMRTIKYCVWCVLHSTECIVGSLSMFSTCPYNTFNQSSLNSIRCPDPWLATESITATWRVVVCDTLCVGIETQEPRRSFLGPYPVIYLSASKSRRFDSRFSCSVSFECIVTVTNWSELSRLTGVSLV